MNGLDFVYNSILDAVGRLPEIQLVPSVGKNVNLGNLRPLPQNVIVTRTAPQIELLKGASLCITHAGLNTTLESLGQGVPMVAIPIGYDQPGVAARIAHHGVGEFIEIASLTTENLQGTILKVLENRRYQENARHFRRVIAQTRGLDIAAEVIEQAFGKKQDGFGGEARV